MRWVVRSLTASGSASSVDERHQIVDPVLDIRLSHAQGELLVEHLQHRQRVDHPAIHPADGDRPAAADDVDARQQAGETVNARLLHHLRGDGISEQTDERLRSLRGTRAGRRRDIDRLRYQIWFERQVVEKGAPRASST